MGQPKAPGSDLVVQASIPLFVRRSELKHLRGGRFAQRLMSAYRIHTFRYHRPWAPQTLVFSGRILRHPSGPLHQLLSFHSRTSKLPQNGVTVCLPFNSSKLRGRPTTNQEESSADSPDWQVILSLSASSLSSFFYFTHACLQRFGRRKPKENLFQKEGNNPTGKQKSQRKSYLQQLRTSLPCFRQPITAGYEIVQGVSCSFSQLPSSKVNYDR